MDRTYDRAQQLRTEKAESKKELHDRLNFTEQQLLLLTQEMKDKIRQMVEDVEQKAGHVMAMHMAQFCCPPPKRVALRVTLFLGFCLGRVRFKFLPRDRPSWFFLVPKLTNSVALVRKQTIPTERPPLVGEVSANFCG
jgi:hypothetical protein